MTSRYSAVSSAYMVKITLSEMRRCSPARVQGQRDLKVGEDGPDQRLDQADREADERGGQHKRPGRVELVLPVLLPHRNAHDGEGPAAGAPSRV